MTDADMQPRVPLRLVLASLAALWACYFIVATLRGAFMGFEFGWPIISRRLTICILSMLVMAALFPLMQMLDRKSFGVRLTAVLVGALPVSLGLSLINEAVFAEIQAGIVEGEQAGGASVKISRDEAGNLLVDLPPAPVPPAPPVPPAGAPGTQPAPPSPPPPPATTVEVTRDSSEITLHTADPATRWAVIADTTFGRYFLVLAWAALYFALAKAEEARAAERREGAYRRAAEAAELRSLRYQVNPHFLFNTLNSLSALVMTGRQTDAETMIQTLSTFYRRTLSGDPTGDATLTDEIEMQKLYLAIESVRFPERLLTEIAVDADVAGAMLPGMILQPLVENSVKYAVAATREPVTIRIAARREGRALVVSVSDNGPGRAANENRRDVAGCGIGLANVRDRLRARFGDAALLVWGELPGGGFRTEFSVPLDGPAGAGTERCHG